MKTTTPSLQPASERVVFLDWLRVIACFMVIMVHSCEPFYLGGLGTYIASWTNGFWANVIDSAFRSSVPLFVLASSYLLFPVKQDTTTFFKRRFSRVFVPFLIWSLLYALIPLAGTGGQVDIAGNLKHLALNFVSSAGHLWFVYMLLGVYVLMPMLSPWIEKLSRREEEVFLGVWLFTTLIPFLRPLAELVTGRPELWGEANWNEFGALYYVSGYVGYLVLGHYFRTYVGEISWKKTILMAVPMWIAGYAIIAGWFWLQMPKQFPVNETIELAVRMEYSWRFCTIGVVLTTVAYFLVIRKITASGWFYTHIILPLSKLSYGIYLMHIFVLMAVFGQVNTWGLSTPVVICVTAVLTFTICAVIAKLISCIPKSKWLIG